ncbi:MAG: hypothetical protein HYV97_18605 [Bdellovibrio sp.]|nr:hypothetical protein [Bdellovibrio sp.]
MRINIILLVSLALLSSWWTACARKSTPSGKVRINLGASAAGGPVLKGVYIWGRNKTFGLTFGAHIAGDGREITLPLKPGVWNFKVIAWDGANMFEGITRCGKHDDIAFQSGDVDVPIHLTTNCGGEYDNAGTLHQFKPLKLVTCRSIALATAASDLCENAYLGETHSFKVILPSYFPRSELEIGEFAPDSLTSECHTISASGASTDLHIHPGNGGPESPRVYIEAYSGGGCSGDHVTKYYLFGLNGAKEPHGKLFEGANQLVFFMQHGQANGGGDLTFFGNGADGDLLISGAPITVNLNTDSFVRPATPSPINKTWSASRRITGITSDGNSSVLTLLGAFNDPEDFAEGDEVLWHVPIATGPLACDSEADNHLSKGSYGTALISAVNEGGLTITIDHAFPTTVSNLGNSLAFANGSGDAQCVMQVMRIPNFKTLTVSTSGTASLGTEAFRLGGSGVGSTGHGGIMAIRVKDRLTINSSATLQLAQSGSGYPADDNIGGTSVTPKFQGVGVDGFTQSNCGAGGCDAPLGMGGGVGTDLSSGNAGGGGGAHVGSGGYGGYGGGAGNAKGKGGLPFNYITHPKSLIMGASGGHGRSPANITAAQSGGIGGGIVMIFAREIIGSGTGAMNVQANGFDGGVTPAWNGGGGGAGGGIHIYTQYSNVATVNGEAKGGSGGASIYCPGGGGGGGYVAVKSCMDFANFSGNVVGGNAGTDGSCTNQPASAGGSGAQNISFSTAHAFCPSP